MQPRSREGYLDKLRVVPRRQVRLALRQRGHHHPLDATPVGQEKGARLEAELLAQLLRRLRRQNGPRIARQCPILHPRDGRHRLDQFLLTSVRHVWSSSLRALFDPNFLHTLVILHLSCLSVPFISQNSVPYEQHTRR